jgi:hypothetical protein
MLSCNTSKPELQTAFNENASINTANTNPLNGIAINTFIHSKEHTASILYGNETAAQYARTKSDGNYPKGSILSLVTWKQMGDPRWFGANIPDSVLKVEVLKFDDSLQYMCYTGKHMEESVNTHADSAIQWMRSQRSVILP